MAQALMSAPVDVDTMRAAFPHWKIFKANGWWFALRRGHCLEAYAGPKSLLRHTLRCRSISHLAELLTAQEYLDALPEGDLNEIYLRPRLAAAVLGVTADAAPC